MFVTDQGGGVSAPLTRGPGEFDLLWPEGESCPVVVEINPRLTTSYVGLRSLCEGNLMQTLLDTVMGRAIVPPVFRAGPMRFSCDGTIIG